MAIRITQSMMYSDMVGQMQKNLAAYMESNEQGSTQKKINRPSDDPAGAYRVLTTRDDLNATAQYQTNVDTARGWLELADSVLSTRVSTLFQDLESLAQQASNTEMSAENRKQIGERVKQIFGQLLNLSNTEFEGKSLFAGHKYDSNAFEQGLALTSWDDNWSGDISQGNYSIQGASDTSMMLQFTSNGNLSDPATYRWSKDGGTTWNDGTVQVNAGPPQTYDMVADGVTVTMKQDMAVNAADVDAGPGAENGTLVYIRPTAVYQGDDKDPPPEMTVMGGLCQQGLGQRHVQQEYAGTHGRARRGRGPEHHGRGIYLVLQHGRRLHLGHGQGPDLRRRHGAPARARRLYGSGRHGGGRRQHRAGGRAGHDPSLPR